MIRNRIMLCLTLPFLWPWRLLQSRIGFPVDMGEFHREIAACWSMKATKEEFFDPTIEPEALCRNCEYFDCQGQDQRALLPEYRGDCGNNASPFFTPMADSTCTKFWPDSTRWPDER